MADDATGDGPDLKPEFEAAGKVWRLRITVGMLPKLKAAGVDVGFAPADVGKVVESAVRDEATLKAVLGVLVGQQLTGDGVTLDELLDAMDGPTLANYTDALLAAVVTFTHRPVVAAAVLRTYKVTADRVVGQVVEAAENVSRSATSSDSVGPSPATLDVLTPAT